MINLNTATLEEIQTLKRIGEKRAQLIIDNRPYKDVYEVSAVSGIGKKVIELIIDSVTV
jgi:competence ComEA-like helix-hairpin-helix protein